MRVNTPTEAITLPCDHCGVKETTVTFDLDEEDVAIRLCSACLSEGVRMIGER